jgi:hypothetical protein
MKRKYFSPISFHHIGKYPEVKQLGGKGIKKPEPFRGHPVNSKKIQQEMRNRRQEKAQPFSFGFEKSACPKILHFERL